jgi:glycerol-3-phosphate dehydrogenase
MLTPPRVLPRVGGDGFKRSLGGRVPRPPPADAPLAGGGLADPLKAIGAATMLTGDAAVAGRLVHAHGDEWRALWSLAERAAALAERIEPTRPFVLAELRWAVERELAFTLADLLIRRIPIAFETRDHGRSAARRVVPLVAEWLGWDADRLGRELERYEAEVERLFGIEP